MLKFEISTALSVNRRIQLLLLLLKIEISRLTRTESFLTYKPQKIGYVFIQARKRLSTNAPLSTEVTKDQFLSLQSNIPNNTMVLLGEIFPDFTADTQMGTIKFHEWLGDSWGILFSHPNDFTPVCTTELARVAKLIPEFKRLGVKVIALSCNTVDSHRKWIEDIKSYGQITDKEFPYPIIEDQARKLATSLGMLDPAEIDGQTGLPMSARAVFIIDPAKKMRLSILYPATTGRNFDEIIRVVESLQLTEKYKVATPVDWKKGDDVMIDPTVSDSEARACYNDIKTVTLPSGRTYLRIVPQPIDA